MVLNFLIVNPQLMYVLIVISSS